MQMQHLFGLHWQLETFSTSSGYKKCSAIFYLGTLQLWKPTQQATNIGNSMTMSSRVIATITLLLYFLSWQCIAAPHVWQCSYTLGLSARLCLHSLEVLLGTTWACEAKRPTQLLTTPGRFYVVCSHLLCVFVFFAKQHCSSRSICSLCYT